MLLTCVRPISSLCKIFVKKSFYSTKCQAKVGYVLGAYENNDETVLTEAASQINDQCSGGLTRQLNYGGPLKAGKSRVLFGLSEEYPVVSVVGLGNKDLVSDPIEERDEGKEAVRSAVAAGCQSLSDFDLEKLVLDPCGDGCSAGEGASLSLFRYQDLKTKKKSVPRVECLSEGDAGWSRGLILGEGQNIARRLMETPANILTPTQFAQESVTALEGVGVTVYVRTAEWAKEHRMGAFLSVSKGSEQPPVFLEFSYEGKGQGKRRGPGAQGTTLALVGKGVTFDAGGISLKPPKNMDLMRGDMGGAAVTVGAAYAAAALKLDINIKGFIPLCENMPSGGANKPGDVVVASNGKTIQIDDTDAEGRLILADALHYASLQRPEVILDMATLTGAMISALGAGAAGAFTNSTDHFALLHRAGHRTGDRVWRMPLWKIYEDQVKDFRSADVHNLGKHAGSAGASLAAAFLQQFVSCPNWLHLDIAGVMENSDEVSYLGKGMSGRPARTVVEYASLLAERSER